MAFKEDFDQFLETRDFAITVTWGFKQFNGIFDNATYTVDNGESQVPVDIQQPQVFVKSSDVEGMVQDEIIHLEDINMSLDADYKVVGFLPDGTGMTELRLVKP